MESYGMAQQPLYSSLEYPHASAAMVGNQGSCAFSGVDSGHVTEGNSPLGELNVYPLQFDRKSDVEPELMDSRNPFNGVNETQDGINSLFSNQDPWMLRHDSHFPPPRPYKFLTKKEVVGAKDAFVDNRLGHNRESPTGNMSPDDGAYPPSANLDMNFNAEHGHSNIGSAEELIKQELQEVAEGVAAFVLHSSTPSNPDSNRHGRSEHALESNQSVISFLTLGEEYRIVAPPPVTLTTTNPTVPVYHPSIAPAAADASYVGGLNSGNVVPPVANWLPRMPPPITSGIPLLPGYGYNINLPPRGYDHGLAPVVVGGGGNASDHTSDEGGDDSVVSGRKVKFLCSFGGKILPRPSDGVLRYLESNQSVISFLYRSMSTT
ncbi:hypothetical protein L6452_34196 [Arctium lappa]|uniref:Uncharacterized protein n=1 Tax=Arctium lappa TaxID=4217 RepID=A0ACB8YHN6_ARCLA|nr:hypothetical protein L6452_34196 [Arctium lappa]